MHSLLTAQELCPGDVLLCRGSSKKKVSVGQKIREVTGSKYTHAAIYIGDGHVVEANPSLFAGVRENRVEDLIHRYSHVAVTRQQDAWPPFRVTAMKTFAKRVVETGAKYNLAGLFKFTKEKQAHATKLMRKIEAYFSGQLQPDSPEKQAYFCSEFVADCLVASGFISPSAAIVFKTSTYASGDLGRDGAFGSYIGYLSACENYEFPEDDDFYSCV